MSSAETTDRNIAWGPSILGTLGSLLFLLGTGRFIHRQRFDFIDALYCCLALVAAGVWLLVLAYVIQHAKWVSVIPLFAAGVMIVSSPIFDVAFGLALIGATAGPALRDWKDESRRRKSAAAPGGEAK